jgi:phage terminase large subunit
MTPILPQPELEERVEANVAVDDMFYCDLNLNRKSRGGYIEDAEIDAMIADWPMEVQTTRIEGRFAAFFGAVFKEYNRKTHVVTPFTIPKDWPRYRTFDFGFTNPFVCLWAAKDPDDNYYIYREYYQAKRTIGEHIPQVQRRSKGERYVRNIADPENASDREELERVGIVTEGANKDVARGIEEVQKKLKVKRDGKPSLFIFRDCRNLTRELSLYHYPKGTVSKNPRDIPVQKNDHTVDALRYLIYTLSSPTEIEGSICAA